MTENEQGKAQQGKLGELFIDLGVKGFPKFLKQLNSISATFLLTKTAAGQLIKPLEKIGEAVKEAGNAGLDITKKSNALATSPLNVQKLQKYLKSKNASEGLINDIAQLETLLYGANHGRGGLPPRFLESLHLLDLNHTNYQGDFESILRFIDDVQTAVKKKNLNPTTRNARYRDLGLSTEWAYLAEQGNFNISDALLLSDRQTKKAVEAANARAEFNQAKENVIDKISAEFFSEPVTQIAKTGTRALNGIAESDVKDFALDAITGVELGGGIANPTWALLGALSQVAAKSLFRGKAFENKQNNPSSTPIKSLDIEGRATGFAAALSSLSATPLNPDWFNFELPKPINDYSSLPIMQEMQAGNGYIGALPNLSQTNHIEIRTENKIYGANPTETANKVTNLITEQMARSQYEAHNLAGL